MPAKGQSQMRRDGAEQVDVPGWRRMHNWEKFEMLGCERCAVRAQRTRQTTNGP